MNIQVQTTRFGQVSIQQEDVITLVDPMLGFPDLRKFVILEDPDDLVFAWLQSCENPAIAFAVLEPELFASDYNVTLGKNDKEALKLTSDIGKRIFNIVTIPEDVTKMTANMKAPFVVNVNNRLAKQVVTQENDHPIKHPIFAELQKRLLQSGLTHRGTAAAAATQKSAPAAVAPINILNRHTPEAQI